MTVYNSNLLLLSERAVDNYFSDKSETIEQKNRLIIEYHDEQNDAYLGYRKLTKEEAALAKCGLGPANFGNVLAFVAQHDIKHRQFSKEIAQYNKNHRFQFLKTISNDLQNQITDPNRCDRDGNTHLHRAVFNGDKAKVQLMIDLKANLSMINNEGQTPLHISCAQAKNEICKMLINAGAPVERRNEELNTSLHLASAMGLVDVMEALRKKGAPIDAKNKDRETSLHLAAKNRQIAAILYLLKAGADKTIVNNAQKQPWEYAKEQGLFNISRMLLPEGVEDELEVMPKLHTACLKGTVEDVLELLTQANINLFDASGWTPLHSACTRKDGDIASLLVQQNANVHPIDCEDKTPLHTATEHHNRKAVRLLLENGAKASAQDSNKQTAAHTAIANGDIEIALDLIAAMDNVDCQDANGDTLLHLACRAVNMAVFEAVLKKSSNVDLTNSRGRTSLHEACENGNFAMTKMLIKHGADATKVTGEGQNLIHLASKKGSALLLGLLSSFNLPADVADNNGLTAYHIAASNKNADAIICLLVDYPKSERESKIPLIDIQDTSQQTPLHHAVLLGDEEMISTLLAYDANPNAQDSTGNSPLHYAAQNCSLQIVRNLKQNGGDASILNNAGETSFQIAQNRQAKTIVNLLRPKK